MNFVIMMAKLISPVCIHKKVGFKSKRINIVEVGRGMTFDVSPTLSLWHTHTTCIYLPHLPYLIPSDLFSHFINT